MLGVIVLAAVVLESCIVICGHSGFYSGWL